MIRVLVISDNIEMVCYFKKLITDGVELKVEVDYAYSSANRSPEKLIEFGARSINLKCQETVAGIIERYKLVFSIHCKQIFPGNLVKNLRCINLHPGLNPFNRGWYPQVFSIINGLPVGATLHYMDEEVDHGGVIAQKETSINSWDTSLEVYNRVIELEKEILSEELAAIIAGNEKEIVNVDEGNYNSIADFKNLCEIDLSDVGTLKNHIDLLRALTHGNYKNAYYLDASGRKIFVSVKFEVEQ